MQNLQANLMANPVTQVLHIHLTFRYPAVIRPGRHKRRIKMWSLAFLQRNCFTVLMPYHAIKCGAENRIATVDTRVAVRHTHKQSLSITNAANFHSLFICSSSSFCLIFDVIFFISLWIASKSLFKISVECSFCMALYPVVGCWFNWPCDVGGLIQSSARTAIPHMPFSARVRYSSSVSRRFGSNACALLSCNCTSPNRCLWIILWRLFSIPGLSNQSLFASQPFKPFFTCQNDIYQNYIMMRNVAKRPLCHLRTAIVHMCVRTVPSDLDILCSLTYTTVSRDSVSGLRRPRSACANAQADLGLRCPQNA